MTAIPTPPVSNLFTPEELETLPGGEHYELVDGQLVETGMSLDSSFVATRLAGYAFVYLQEHPMAWCFDATASYRAFPVAPDQVRRPDLSFVARDRLPDGIFPRGHCRLAPDLVVEVMSDNDIATDLERKIGEYLSGGVRLIWIISPETRTARVQRLDGSGVFLREDGLLSGEEVLPGFAVRLTDVLPAPRPPAPPTPEPDDDAKSQS